MSYGTLARRALDYNRLTGENARLELENRRIIRVAREVDQSRQILAQIIRSLGGHLELGRAVGEQTETLLEEYEDSQLSVDAEGLLEDGSFAVNRIAAYEMPTLIPLDGFISRGFSQDFLFPERSHRGIDIAGKSGTPVLAAASGRVVFSGWTPDFGNCIILAHKNGYMTFYGHNQANLKGADIEVERGEPIAQLGTSGRSSAPHVHFEIWKDGVAVDPLEFVR